MDSIGRPQRPLHLLLVLLLASACSPSEEGGARRSADRTPGDPGGDVEEGPIRPGVEVLLSDSLHLVEGRRVALVTNHTGVDGAGRSSIDLLHEHPGVELVALFGPEHGLRGDAGAGDPVESGTDARTGLPVHSLYSSTRRPPPETLEGVDALLFDIQDVGARYYTYVSTMARAMEAAGEAGIPFVVLDRPNPIDGVHVQGTVLDPAFSTFVGLYPVPMRHGMTPGELARLYVGEFGIEVELHVVPAAGWRRGMLFDATGLPWIPPSPNMPSLESALHYPGTCLFEGTNLSVGRGTDRAFQWIGAPWLDGGALAANMAEHDLPGVRIEAVTFVPEAPGDGKYDGETVAGVRFTVTDPGVYDPTRTAVAALLEARRLAGDRWEWLESHFDRLAGTDRLRAQIDESRSLDEITGAWAGPLADFRALRRPYLVYGR
ncbi:MAG: DUF1343 domain-containing protein [Gemmatimonadota bacterium]|jgi:uncharacterized protein YbbC (DUF1343 family)